MCFASKTTYFLFSGVFLARERTILFGELTLSGSWPPMSHLLRFEVFSCFLHSVPNSKVYEQFCLVLTFFSSSKSSTFELLAHSCRNYVFPHSRSFNPFLQGHFSFLRRIFFVQVFVGPWASKSFFGFKSSIEEIIEYPWSLSLATYSKRMEKLHEKFEAIYGEKGMSTLA